MKSSYSGSRSFLSRASFESNPNPPSHPPSIHPSARPSIDPSNPSTYSATHWFQSSNNPATSCHPSHRPSLRRSRLWRKLPCWRSWTRTCRLVAGSACLGHAQIDPNIRFLVSTVNRIDWRIFNLIDIMSTCPDMPRHALTIPFGSFWCRSAEQPQIRKSEYVELDRGFPQRFQRIDLHTLPVPWGQSGWTRLEINSQLNRTHQRCHRLLQACQLPRRWGVMSEVPLEAPQVCPISFTYPNSCPDSIMRYPSCSHYNLSFMKSSYSGSRSFLSPASFESNPNPPSHPPSIHPSARPSIDPSNPSAYSATHWFQSSNNPATSCHPSHRPSLRRSRLWRKLPCWRS